MSQLKIRKRQSTITQQYSPQFRRRITSNNLSLSLQGQFLTQTNIHFSDSQELNHSTNLNSNSKSQQNFDRKLEKAKQLYESSIVNYNKINDIIDAVDEIIKNRMQAHQVSLLTVVRSEIDKMQQDCKRVVQEYNQMIEEKNKETEIYHLKNEVDYFRNAAMKYFKQNKSVREQNKQLRMLLGNKDSVIDELNSALEKVTKKYLKQKSIKKMMGVDLKTDSNKKSKQNDKQQLQLQSQVKMIRQINKGVTNNEQQENLRTKIKSEFTNNKYNFHNHNHVQDNDYKQSGDCLETDQKSNNVSGNGNINSISNRNIDTNFYGRINMNMTTKLDSNIKKNIFNRYQQSNTFRKVQSHSLRRKLKTEMAKTSIGGASAGETNKRLNSGQSKSFWKLSHQN